MEQKEGREQKSEKPQEISKPKTQEEIAAEKAAIDEKISNEMTGLNGAREKVGLPPTDRSVAIDALKEQRDRLTQPKPDEGLDEGRKEGHEEQKNVEREESPENQEKRERMKQISERVEQGFDSAKERMTSLEQRYDQIFGIAQEKFSKLAERFPNIIKPEFLDRIDQKNAKVKDAYANMFAIYDSGNERMQTMFQSLPVEFMSMEQIDSIDRSVDKIFETIDRGEEKIQEKLDYLESTVDRIPDMREAIRKPKEVKEAKENIEESELLGKKPEEEIELNQ